MDLLGAVYEGIAFAHYDEICRLKQLNKIKEGWLVGGGAKGDIWCEIFANVIGIPLKVSKSEEICTRGAVYCAAITTGLIGSWEDLGKVRVPKRKIYLPHEKFPKRYVGRFEMYKEIVNQLDGVWSKIDKFQNRR